MRLARCETVGDVVREQLCPFIRYKACGHGLIVPAKPLLALAMLHCWPRHMMAIAKHLKPAMCRTLVPDVRPSAMAVDSPAIGPVTDPDLKRYHLRLR